MNDKTTEQAMIAWLTCWAETRDDLRACILTSSRVNPSAPVDILSDYDAALDQRVVAYLRRAKNLPRDAQSLDALGETEAA